jgi:hypothetical protein
MYLKNNVSKRRPSGWADRRRYFRHLIARARTRVLRETGIAKMAPAGVKE